MTNEQRRFEVAKAMMQGLVTNPDWDECDFEVIAGAAVDAADCLLEELANRPITEKRSVVSIDDGWTQHTPGDPMPCNEFTNVEVMFPDREVLIGSAGYWRSEGSDPKNPLGNWDKCEENPNDAIIAWRPSL